MWLSAWTGLDHNNLKTANASAALIDAESTTLSGTIHTHSQWDVWTGEFIAIHPILFLYAIPSNGGYQQNSMLP